MESEHMASPPAAPLRPPLAGNPALTERVDRLTREGELYRKLDSSTVRCLACAHRCLIRAGGRGVCQVRFNRDGSLYVPWGYVTALNADPTEKKPFYHVCPGSMTFTFGMLGCDLHCPYCQNWRISQSLRDADAGEMPGEIAPTAILTLAERSGAACIASSYNEPSITSEWAREIFRLSKAAGLITLYVSNGHATREVLEYLRPYTDGYKIDLKTMRDRSYRQLGAPLNRVLDGIRMVHELGFWLEVVTLVIPGFNDSDAELRAAAQFIVSLSPDIPWHVTAFHADYHLRDHPNTHARTLMRAAETGRSEGLRYVYAGNLPGQVGDYEATACPNCHRRLIHRYGLRVLDNRLTGDGRCPDCFTPIPGIWQRAERRALYQKGGFYAGLDQHGL